MSNLFIRKKSGDLVQFDPLKLKQSLLQSGASESDANYVSNTISSKIIDGMSTHKVYQMAYSILRRKSGKIAGRYRLKKAIFDMGPTGYPFESLVGELIKLQGYDTKTGIVLEGQCVQHEVDVLAKSNSTTIFVECKFHNDIRRKSDVKVSLYVKSRFDDLKNKWKNEVSDNHHFEGWLVTNTRFTSDATQYGICAGLKLISWDYPLKGNLRQLIDESGFHPITTMHSITKKEKAFLMEKNITLCRQLFYKADLLKEIGIVERRIQKIINEAGQIAELT
jgi:restriction endonuclease